jgi:hypothetical protein
MSYSNFTRYVSVLFYSKCTTWPLRHSSMIGLFRSPSLGKLAIAQSHNLSLPPSANGFRSHAQSSRKGKIYAMKISPAAPQKALPLVWAGRHYDTETYQSNTNFIRFGVNGNDCIHNFSGTSGVVTDSKSSHAKTRCWTWF